jgi:hypothetical protein
MEDREKVEVTKRTPQKNNPILWDGHTFDTLSTTHIPHPKMLQREITEMKIKGSIKTNR